MQYEWFASDASSLFYPHTSILRKITNICKSTKSYSQLPSTDIYFKLLRRRKYVVIVVTGVVVQYGSINVCARYATCKVSDMTIFLALNFSYHRWYIDLLESLIGLIVIPSGI